MPQIDSPEYLQIGQFKTGNPGSKRRPYFIGAALEDWSTGPAVKTIPPEHLENRSKHTFFVERILFAVSGVYDAFASRQSIETLIRIRPAQHRAWMDELIHVIPLFDPDGRVVSSGDAADRTTRILTLPEPYPIKPGNTFQIDAQCITGAEAATTKVLIGLHGYIETDPAYSEPRTIPFYQGDSSVIAPGESDLYEFSAGEPYILQSINIRSFDNGPPYSEAYGFNSEINFSYSIKGKPKIVETPVPLGALQDYHSRAIPAYGAAVQHRENVNLRLNNIGIVSSAKPLIALRGYRRVT